MYESREGSFVHVTPDGEHIEVVGVRVLNDNPRYPIRVNAVAFTPADQQTQPQLWFSEKWGLPMNIEPRDADTLDIPIDYISEERHPLGPSFVGWIELKTGAIHNSAPHPSPQEG